MTANASDLTHTPSWTVDSLTSPTKIEVVLRLATTAPAIYDRTKTSVLDDYSQRLTNPTSSAVDPSELGPQVQEAVMISGTSKSSAERTDGQIVLRSGNAVASITYTSYSNGRSPDAAVKAIAADLVSNLR
ncbi:hypothetical protein ACFXG4_41390 [Nocardia sp. NPDC059246]|uniref:hypothetical protein n=1 Tax=unclassified Nocardia TaxID=2637762 RepID=UPI0036D187A9